MKTNKWLAFISVGFGTFMSTLDGGIVGVSLPTITKFFQTTLATVEWAVLIYLMVILSLLISFGRLADMIGRKKIFITGFFIFTLASCSCGLSPSVLFLIISRALQGLGAAMIMANSPAIITTSFPAQERGKALGMLGSVVSAGLIAGPSLGGIITSTIGWRYIFFINLPIGIIAILIAWIVIKETVEPRQKQKFDFIGTLIFILAVASIFYALNKGQEMGWNSITIILSFALFIIFISIFIIYELKNKQPILEFKLFRNRLFSAANASNFICFTALFMVIFLIPFYLERVGSFKILTVGLMMTTIPLTQMVIAPISGWLSDKIGSRFLSSTGLLIASLGIFLLGLVGKELSYLNIFFRLVIIGFGMGTFQAPNYSAIMGSAPKERLGFAASFMVTMRSLGMAIGVALSGAIFSIFVQSQSGQIVKEIIPSIIPVGSFVYGVQATYMITAGICFLGVFISLTRGPRQTEPVSSR